jgi:hypothetical protein
MPRTAHALILGFWVAWMWFRARTRRVRTRIYACDCRMPAGRTVTRYVHITRDRGAVTEYRYGRSISYFTRFPDLLAWRMARQLKAEGYARTSQTPPHTTAAPVRTHRRCAVATPNRLEGQRLMANLAPSSPQEPDTAAQDRAAVIAGATRIFREIGVTAADLRHWAPWCPALGDLADAMDAPLAGTA